MAKDIDWDYIRDDYENTTKSIRLLARENDVSHGAIQRRIKVEQWEKSSSVDAIKDKSLIGANPLLDKIALKKAHEIISDLGENYSSLDEPLVAVFVHNYSKWVTVQFIIKEEGSVITSEKGSVYISPYENLASQYENKILKVASQLGLSLSSRKRIGISSKSDTDEPDLFTLSQDVFECDLDV